jgi:hypothetical protein
MQSIAPCVLSCFLKVACVKLAAGVVSACIVCCALPFVFDGALTVACHDEP